MIRDRRSIMYHFGRYAFLCVMLFCWAIATGRGPVAAQEVVVEEPVLEQPTPMEEEEVVSDLAPESADTFQLQVDLTQARHNINPFIYGMNYATEEQARMWYLPINRSGGNAASRYNWEIDVYNTGNHWYYRNINVPGTDPTNLPYGSSTDRFVAQNIATNTQSLMQLSMLGWVPKDRLETCGFSEAIYGEQLSDDAGCGNGAWLGTEEVITGNDPTETSIAVDETFQKRWIEHLIGQFGTASSGGVGYYSLDNEPMIWQYNHRDVHPQPSSFDSVTQKGITYAKMVKAIDPNAKVIGPSVWGWQAYFYSGLDWTVPDRHIDREAHGNLPFLVYYLQEMARFERENGYRLLDYLDVHYYPQGSGEESVFAIEGAGDEDVQARRLRSTQELWNEEWVAESWINEPIGSLRVLRRWIDEHYPKTKLSLSEYRWGGLESINGALAQADVLGIFGRERVDMAFLWDAPAIGWPGDFAIRMYRNYDGKGGRFGNIALTASSPNEQAVSIYAATRSFDDAVTVMVINKTKEWQAVQVALEGLESKSAELYRYSSANLATIELLPEQQIDANGFLSEGLPPESITLYVIERERAQHTIQTAQIIDWLELSADCSQEPQDRVSLTLVDRKSIEIEMV